MKTKIQVKERWQKGWETISVSYKATIYDLTEGHQVKLPGRVYDELENCLGSETETDQYRRIGE